MVIVASLPLFSTIYWDLEILVHYALMVLFLVVWITLCYIYILFAIKWIILRINRTIDLWKEKRRLVIVYDKKVKI